MSVNAEPPAHLLDADTSHAHDVGDTHAHACTAHVNPNPQWDSFTCVKFDVLGLRKARGQSRKS